MDLRPPAEPSEATAGDDWSDVEQSVDAGPDEPRGLTTRAPLATRMRRVARRVFTTKSLVLAGVIVLVSYLALTPIIYLLVGTLFPEGTFTLGGFERAYGATGIGTMVRNSVVFAIGASLLSLILGTTLAYVTARTNVPFRRLLILVALVPLIIPQLLYTIAWIMLSSQNVGLVNDIARAIIGVPVFDIFSISGMIWVEGTDTTPLVFLFMFAAFRQMDPSLEESALVSGASRTTMLRRVTLPLVRPAIGSAMLIVFVKSLESFEVPALLGLPRGIYVFTSRIFYALRQYPFDYAAAGALSLTLIAIAVIGIYTVSRMRGHGDEFATVTGKGFRPQTIDLGNWKYAFAAGAMLYFFITAVLPVFILTFMSFVPSYQSVSIEAFGKLTLNNYDRLFNEFGFFRSVRNSLTLSLSASTFVVILTAIAAWFVIRSRVRGRQLLDHLTFLPLVIPGLVMGVAISFVYLRNPLPFAVYGTLWILFIAYITRYMPYGMRYAVPSLTQVSGELEESAQVAGASWWQINRRIVVPLIMPGLLAGWIYIMILSIRELSSSILLYSPGNEVISIIIWELFEKGEVTTLAAFGVILVAFLVLLVTVAYKLGGKIGVQQD